MATLTADEIAVARQWVGDKVTDDDLNARYTRLGDLDSTVEEVLRYQIRVAADKPSNISLPGGLSIGQGNNLSVLQSTLKEFISRGGTDGDTSTGSTVATGGKRVRKRLR